MFAVSTVVFHTLCFILMGEATLGKSDLNKDKLTGASVFALFIGYGCSLIAALQYLISLI